MPEPEGHVVALDDLEHTAHSHEFVGAEHGDVPFSIILVHSQPGRRARSSTGTRTPRSSSSRRARRRSGSATGRWSSTRGTSS